MAYAEDSSKGKNQNLRNIFGKMNKSVKNKGLLEIKKTLEAQQKKYNYSRI